jgi:hypothetical protein
MKTILVAMVVAAMFSASVLAASEPVETKLFAKAQSRFDKREGKAPSWLCKKHIETLKKLSDRLAKKKKYAEIGVIREEIVKAGRRLNSIKREKIQRKPRKHFEDTFGNITEFKGRTSHWRE